MSDTIVKKEKFFGANHRVDILTVEVTNPDEAWAPEHSRYFVILRDDVVVYTSPAFFGGSTEDVRRNCNHAIKLVRVLLSDMNFILESSIGT